MRTVCCLILGIALGGYGVPKVLVWHWHRVGVLPAAAKVNRSGLYAESVP